MYKEIFSEEEIIKRKKIWSVLVKNFFQRYVNADNDTVLDLGCGWGEFVNTIKAKRRIGLDISKDCFPFVDKDVEFIVKSCTDSSLFSNDSINVIFSSNLFEHLPKRDDVYKSIKECYRVLGTGGKILILMPNFKFCYRKYFDFFDHYHAFTHRSMEEVCGLAGFQIVKTYQKFLPFSTK